MTSQLVVTLLGRQGTGKTTLMNKLTGARFAVSGGARSCTDTLQFNQTRRYGILCVDTPGFHSSSDIAHNIAAQKIALEGTALSGVYVVVKHGRADDISEMLGNIMDFVGEDIRIIVTHEDVAQQGVGYNRDELKQLLSDNLGIPTCHIITIGKDTDANAIEGFIHSSLHEPRCFEVDDHQLASLASLCVGPRQIEKRIQVVYAKIQAASSACQELVRNGKSYATDHAITVAQHDTAEMVKGAKEELFQWAYECLTHDQQHVVYGKAGLKLSIRLKDFIETTNKFLSYDVASPSNQYKKCPYCNEIFIKTEGCDGETTCGDVPVTSDAKVSQPRTLVTSFIPQGHGWQLQFTFAGLSVTLESMFSFLSTRLQEIRTTRNSNLRGRGCGQKVNWSMMPPLSPEELQALGFTETLNRDSFEEVAKIGFEESVHEHEHAQRQAFADALLGSN